MMSVLFYSDAADFGGHEAMTLEAVRCLSRRGDFSVVVAFYEGNERLRTALEQIANSTEHLALMPLKFKSKSLQAFRSLASVRRISYLKHLMKRVDPKVVVVSQGRIESASLALLAAKRAGLRTISYIPMAHLVSVSGIPVAVRLREMVNTYLYRLPDRIITISDSARGMLIERGVTQNIAVVPNGIEVKCLSESDRNEFRRRLGVTESEYVVGVVGRIEFRQKGQDFAVETIRRFRDRLEGYRFMFIGEGPDAQKLREMISSANLLQVARVLPWCNDPGKIYAALDMLLIPSRFEGVPLVMLEAMSYGLPIVASDSDGMADLLPKQWLFPFGDHQALVDRLAIVRHSENSQILESHRVRIAKEFSSANFCAKISAAICDGWGDHDFSFIC